MALTHYTAEVKEGLLLALPMEAEELHLKPGDKVRIRLDRAIEDVARARPGEVSSPTPKALRGLGAFKGKLGGTEALFQEKQADIQREERRF